MSYDKTCPETIQSMFGSIASRYDLANAVLSLGTHAIWNRILVNALRKRNPAVHLDLCCGTGAIGLLLARKHKRLRKLHLLDFSIPMLEVATARAMRQNVRHFAIHPADAQDIPLPSNSVDTISIAYGIRNVQDIDKLAAELMRVLKPGGVVGILELTWPKNFLSRFWLERVIPKLGKWLTGDGQAYCYLAESIKNFDPPHQLQLRLQKAKLVPLHPPRPLMQGAATLFMLGKGQPVSQAN